MAMGLIALHALPKINSHKCGQNTQTHKLYCVKQKQLVQEMNNQRFGHEGQVFRFCCRREMQGEQHFGWGGGKHLGGGKICGGNGLGGVTHRERGQRSCRA